MGGLELSVESNTSYGGLKIDMPGRMGDARRVGGWPNLVEVANLAIGHFNEISDPYYSHMSYVGASVGLETPVFQHTWCDSIEASSYALPGRISARRLTGNRSGEEVEIGQRKLTLGAFHNLDGLAHRSYVKGWCEDTTPMLWEQVRVLYTLMSWFVESGEEGLLDYVRGMLRALLRSSRKEGEFRLLTAPFDREDPFSDVGAMVLVEPLMKYYEVSGDSDALEFCEGIVNWAVAPETNFVDREYRLSGWLRSLAAGLAGVVRFATHTADEKLLDRTERMFHTASTLTTGFGATPDTEPCCTNMELSTSALALARAGRGQWWDMVDRHFRNHTLECQFTDPEALNRGYVEGEPGPADDTRDIINRSIGGFSWATAREHMYIARKVMLCCGGNAMWTLGKIVDNAVTEEGEGGLSINLHFSVDTPLASITNCEPFEGRLEVVPRRQGAVRIRRPSYAAGIQAELDGAPAHPKEEGDYLVFAAARNGSTIRLTYPLPERTTEETTLDTPYVGGMFGEKSDAVVSERIQATWRGNTVLAIDYDSDSPQPKHRLYLNRMGRYTNGEGRDDIAAFFLPERKYDW